MKIKDLLSVLDTIAPFALAESWDHCGLRLGSESAEVSGVAVCLDPSAEAVKKAASLGCNVLLTHHPLMFSPQENMICDRTDTKTIAAAFALGVNIIACHTCLDSARGGVNDHLAALAGLSDVVPLCKSEDERGFGMGAFGTLSPCDGDALCERIARAWGLSGCRVLGSCAEVSRVGLCGGAGGDLWMDARKMGAQLYISADLRYHECLEALDAGLQLMICDHGEMENPALLPFADRVREKTKLPVYFCDLVTPRRDRESWRSLS